ncbi:MAG: glycosyl hydrolase [Burkholderiales bacterium]|nr:glycosyl hydrolase [Burkholderiales bacterium]
MRVHSFTRALPVVAAALFAASVVAAPFVDPLDTPAAVSPLASRTLLQGVARAGDRVVAVGQRGHIVVSTDQGKTWRQAKVPVSSDLTAVFFVDDRKGWAVGHDGVVLASEDGGDTWQLQLDGRRANVKLVEHMQQRVAEAPDSKELARLLEDAKRYVEQGADKPFLDVWFSDASTGYVVGAYNLIFRTTDGGKNWQPWFDRTDNPKAFNLYAIRPVAGDLYIAGEGGLALKLDPAAERFRALDVPYKGSFFGVTGGKDGVVLYGLRGNVYRSGDAGRTWSKADAGLVATVTSAARTSADAILLADAGGRFVESTDGGRAWSKVAASTPVPVTGFAELGGGRFALVGPRGATVTELTPR